MYAHSVNSLRSTISEIRSVHFSSLFYNMNESHRKLESEIERERERERVNEKKKKKKKKNEKVDFTSGTNLWTGAR